MLTRGKFSRPDGGIDARAPYARHCTHFLDRQNERFHQSHPIVSGHQRPLPRHADVAGVGATGLRKQTAKLFVAATAQKSATAIQISKSVVDKDHALRVSLDI